MKFYLYVEKDIPNLFEYYNKYSLELHKSFFEHPNRTDKPSNADIFITCFSDEWHYYKPSTQHARLQCNGKQRKTITFEDIQKKCTYINNGPHTIFYHSDQSKLPDNIVNIPYCTFSQTAPIMIPPPILDLNRYHNTKKRNVFVSFKGQLKRPSVIDGVDRRKKILKDIKLNYPGVTIEPGKPNRDKYGPLLSESVFGLVVEGDLPWSYRLCEVINSGAIPVIILSDIKSPTGEIIQTLPGRQHTLRVGFIM